MAMIPLTPELFPGLPVYWMDEVGPVVIMGAFAFCCESDCESEKDSQIVRIYEKPGILPDDPDEAVSQTRQVAERNFKNENSMVHIRNFIVKFAKDAAYRQDFSISPPA